MNPNIPISPFGPGGGMATANPAANPQLFTKRPDGPARPTYEPPGALMTAAEALALLDQLTRWGVAFDPLVVYEIGGNPEKTYLAGDPSDTTRRRYFSGIKRAAGLDGEHDLILVRQTLGGVLSSPVVGLAQIAAERGVPPIRLGHITSEEIVAALRAIFG